MPSYIVNVTNVAQIQLAINFARNLNLRLSIKNQGHDFNSKNVGAGSVSIWTSHLNHIQYLGPDFTVGPYSGPALKIGAGVETLQVYEYADNLGLEVVGGVARVSVSSQSDRPQRQRVRLTYFLVRLLASVAATSRVVAIRR